MTGTPPCRLDSDALTGRVLRVPFAGGELLLINGPHFAAPMNTPWCAEHSRSAHACELAAVWSSPQAGASR